MRHCLYDNEDIVRPLLKINGYNLYDLSASLVAIKNRSTKGVNRLSSSERKQILMPNNIKDVLIGILLADTLRCIVLSMLLLYLFQINICFQENIFLFNNPNLISLSCLSPVFVYNELKFEKPSGLTENKGKSGVYLWTNKVNGKKYIGSSVDLAKRLKNYFNISYLKEFKDIMLIYKALLAHGFDNFRLDILEHCKPSDLIKREQYYIDLLNPEYSILKICSFKIRS